MRYLREHRHIFLHTHQGDRLGYVRRRQSSPRPTHTMNEKFSITPEWVGQDGKRYRSFRRWQGDGWTQSFLQCFQQNRWVTLY